MFERFTDRARRVVVFAEEEARILHHGEIGTEHLLLGLIREREGVAASALESLGISLEAVRSQVEEIIGQGRSSPSGHLPFTPRAKNVLELSLREALQLGHNYIGTEHILLGLIREGEGVAAQVLVNLGADLPRVRRQVVQLLADVARRHRPSVGLRPATGPTDPASRPTPGRARRSPQSCSASSRWWPRSRCPAIRRSASPSTLTQHLARPRAPSRRTPPQLTGRGPTWWPIPQRRRSGSGGPRGLPPGHPGGGGARRRRGSGGQARSVRPLRRGLGASEPHAGPPASSRSVASDLLEVAARVGRPASCRSARR